MLFEAMAMGLSSVVPALPANAELMGDAAGASGDPARRRRRVRRRALGAREGSPSAPRIRARRVHGCEPASGCARWPTSKGLCTTGLESPRRAQRRRQQEHEAERRHPASPVGRRESSPCRRRRLHDPSRRRPAARVDRDPVLRAWALAPRGARVDRGTGLPCDPDDRRRRLLADEHRSRCSTSSSLAAGVGGSHARQRRP